jgi:hypothetical protein
MAYFVWRSDLAFSSPVRGPGGGSGFRFRSASAAPCQIREASQGRLELRCRASGGTAHTRVATCGSNKSSGPKYEFTRGWAATIALVESPQSCWQAFEPKCVVR